MKKYIIMMVLLFVFSVVVYLHSDEKTDLPKPVLCIGSECDYVPNSWEEDRPSAFNLPIVNHDSYYVDGYDIQIAKIVADKLGMTLEVKKILWNDLLPALNNGEIDAIFSSMLDTKERRKLAAFSEPYEAIKTEYAIIIDSVSPYITAKSLRDFRGARIVAERGTKLDDAVVQIPGVIHLKPREKVQDVIDEVLQGRADGAVIETDTGHYYETMNKNLTLIKFPDKDGFKLDFNGVCAAVRKSDAELLNKINIALDTIGINERHKIMDTVTARMMTNVH